MMNAGCVPVMAIGLQAELRISRSGHGRLVLLDALTGAGLPAAGQQGDACWVPEITQRQPTRDFVGDAVERGPCCEQVRRPRLVSLGRGDHDWQWPMMWSASPAR